MSDYIEVVATLEWIMSEIEQEVLPVISEEAHIDAEKVNEIQHFDWSNLKTILVKEKPLKEGAPVKAKEIYVEREEVEEADTSIKAEEIPVESEKVNEIQHFDWRNLKTILVEEKPLKAQVPVKAKYVYVEAEDIPINRADMPVEGAETSIKAEFDWRFAKKKLFEDKPRKAEAPVKENIEAQEMYVNHEKTPVEQNPVEQTPVEQTTVEETPVEQTTVEEAPVEQTTVEEAPVEETPVEQTPVEHTPIEETPVEETHVEHTPVEETTVEEATVEQTPVEHTPIEETHVEETHVEETPVEETPVEETPVEEDHAKEAPVKVVVKAKDMTVKEEEILVEAKETPVKAEEGHIIQHFDWRFPKSTLVEEKPLDICRWKIKYGDGDVDHQKEYQKGVYSVCEFGVNELECKVSELEEKEISTNYKTKNVDDEAMGARESFSRPRTGPPLLMLNNMSCQPRPSRLEKQLFFGVTWGYHMDVDPVLMWKDQFDLILEHFEESDNVVYHSSNSYYAPYDNELKFQMRNVTSISPKPDEEEESDQVDNCEGINDGSATEFDGFDANGTGDGMVDVRKLDSSPTTSSSHIANSPSPVIIRAIDMSSIVNNDDTSSVAKEPTTPKSSCFGGMWRKMKKFFRGRK